MTGEIPNEAAVVALLRFADGDESAETVQWLRGGFRAWLWHSARGAPPPLLRCLGLPPTDKKLRQAMRDHWLAIAGDTIEARTRTERARVLAAACARFEGAEWLCWRRLPVPPAYASELHQALFYARRQGLALPRSLRQLWPLVAANRGERCRALGRSWEGSSSMSETDEPVNLHP